MRSAAVLLALPLLGFPLALPAQAGLKDPTQFVPRAEVAVGYQFLHTNAPPSGCNCFGTNGAFASVAVKYKYWLSFAGEVTGSHANNISSLGQNLTLTSFTAGPRVTFRGSRLVYFGQALVGGAHASDSYFPTASSYTTSSTSFAISAGGGIDYNIGHRFAIRPVEVQYLHTSFPNGVNDSENHLLIGAGLVLKFHGRYALPHVDAPPPPPSPPPPPPVVEPPTEPAGPTSPPPPPPAPVATQAAFHEHVKDAYFDYNSATLRSDTLQAIANAAAYLQLHPDIHVLVGGYADERGTQEYNLVLGEQRATAARNALVQAGLPADRITIVSYGKGVQVCTATAETCFQQNRRAAFLMNP